MTHAPEQARPHLPVMLHEVLEALSPKDGEVIVDGTFGAGGYSQAILDAAECHVIGLDRDPSVAVHVERLKQHYGERFIFHQGQFSQIDSLLAADAPVDGIVLDIGVSSMQLDQAERGFSFRFEAPLDMRMSGEGQSAADLVNTLDERALADLIWTYGEEKASRRIARAIVMQREEEPIATTRQLKEIIHKIIPPHAMQIDPATRTFQALRIAVNQELQELEQVLAKAEHLLKENGRLVVVTFHSLEDRIVKKFLKTASETHKAISRHMPVDPSAEAMQPVYTMLTRKAWKASAQESATNPRARSAKLRAAIRTAHPAREIRHA